LYGVYDSKAIVVHTRQN